MSWNTATYLLQGNFLSIAKLKISLLKYLTHRRFRLYHVKASLNFLRIDSAKHHIAILERLKRADQMILSLLPFAVLYRISGCIIWYVIMNVAYCKSSIIVTGLFESGEISPSLSIVSRLGVSLPGCQSSFDKFSIPFLLSLDKKVKIFI